MDLVDRFRDLLDYDPITGFLTWKRDGGARARAGAAVGRDSKRGYLSVRIDKKPHRVHKVAWAVYYGAMPPAGFDIDHINGDRSDNRLCNLRLATRQQNNGNARISKGNTSGFKGVTRPLGRKKWLAQIMVNRENRYLGWFDTPEDAARAYDRAAVEAFGDYARTAFTHA